MPKLIWVSPPPVPAPPAPPAPPPPEAPVPAPVPVPVPPSPPAPAPVPVRRYVVTCPAGTVPDFFDTTPGFPPAAVCMTVPGNIFAGWATVTLVEE